MEQFIIFIIVAVVGLLFNRSKLKGQDQHPEHPRPVQTAPIQEDEDQEWEEPAFFEEIRSSGTLKEAADHLKGDSDFYQKQQEAKAKLLELERKEKSHRRKAETLKREDSYDQGKPFINLKEKDIINGIIMSEVLGPPRAKKPYKRRRY